MRRFIFSVLTLSLVLGGCSRTSQEGISVDRAFRPLIPPDTKVLAGANLEKIKSAPLYQRHSKQLEVPIFDSAAERVGLDPRRDISDVLVAWNGKQRLVMMHGRFNPAEVEKKLSSLGAQRANYSKYTLLADGNNAVTFLTKAVAVQGSPEALHAVIDLEEKGDGEVPEQLQDRLRRLPKTGQVWEVSRGGLPFAEAPMRSDAASMLSNIAAYIQATSAAIEIDTGLHLQADIACISTEGAQRVRDALKGAIGFGRLSTRDTERDLLRLYDAIQVQQEQQAVHVRADLPADLSDKLLAYLPSTGERSTRK